MMNVINYDEFKERIAKISGELVNVLKVHCGPTAGNAMWVGNKTGSRILDLVFSNDGISIVDAISSDDPVEQHFIGFLRFIGASVNHETKDNTTTSMLFAAAIVHHALKQTTVEHTKNVCAGLTSVRQQILNSVIKWDDDHSDLLRELQQRNTLFDNVEITDEILRLKIKRFIIENIAMTSSKGNVGLTKAIMELFVNANLDYLPETWERSHGEAEVHGGTSYTVKYPEYQFIIPYTRTTTTSVLTANEMYKYELNKVPVIVTDEDIGTGVLGAVVYKFLEELDVRLTAPEDGGSVDPALVTELFKERLGVSIRDQKNIVLMYPSCNKQTAHLIASINNKWLSTSDRRRLIPVDISSQEYAEKSILRNGERLLQSFMAMCETIVPTYRTVGEAHLCSFDELSIRFKDSCIEINDLYTLTDGLTPYGLGTDRLLVEQLTDQIKQVDIQHALHGEYESTLIAQLKLNIQLLLHGPNPKIHIEGLMHDVRHKILVLEDVYGSVHEALRSGVVIGGIPRVAYTHFDSFSNAVQHALRSVLHATFAMDGGAEWAHTSYVTDDDKWGHSVVQTDNLSGRTSIKHRDAADVKAHLLDDTIPIGTLITPMVSTPGLLMSIDRISELIEPFLNVRTFIDRTATQRTPHA